MSILAENIISHLQSKTSHQLPKYGVLAGQSVAEAYFRIKDIPIETRIKDIDLFINLKNERYRKKYSEYTKWGTSKKPWLIRKDTNIKIVKKGIVHQSYAEEIIEKIEMIEEENTDYKIVDTSTIDIVNIIEVKHNEHGETNHVRFLKNTVDAFDINAIEIGVCLNTKRVYMTKSFKDFLKTKQVEITNTVKPARTVCRFLEKSQYYKGVYFNFDHEVNFMLSHYILNDHKNNKKLRGIKLLRENYNKLSERNKELLDKYFNIKFESFESFKSFHLTMVDEAVSYHCGIYERKGLKTAKHILWGDIETFIEETIIYDKNVLIINPPFNYLAPKEHSLEKLLGGDGKYQNIYNSSHTGLRAVLEYAKNKENNKITPVMDRYRKKVTREQQKNRFTILASSEIEIVKLEPKIRRFDPVLRKNLSHIAKAKKRKDYMLHAYKHRDFNQMLHNKNKAKLLFCDMQAHEKKISDYSELMLLCIEYGIDFMRFFQLKQEFQKAALRHIDLTKNIIMYHQLKRKKEPFCFELYASKVREIERSSYIYLIGFMENNTLPIDSIYDTVEEMIEEARKRNLFKRSVIEELNSEHLIFKNYNIKHVQDTFTLRVIGDEMNHCVGGYGRELVKKEQLFFDVYDENRKRYTLSIYHKEAKDRISLKIGQVYKKNNIHPPKKVKKEMLEFTVLLEKRMQKEYDAK